MKKTITCLNIGIIVFSVALLVLILDIPQKFIPGIDTGLPEAQMGSVQNKIMSVKNISYIIDGKEFALQDGRAENVSVLGEPVVGDLDNDAKNEAAVVLAVKKENGTLYYVAAAVDGGNGYKGTNAVLLGSDAIPKTLKINNGVISIDYGAGIRYMFLKAGVLKEILPIGKDEQVFEGYFVMDHEARSFRMCGDGTKYWLMIDSPMIDKIRNAFANVLSGVTLDTPLYVVVVGKIIESPKAGIDAGYTHAMAASKMLIADSFSGNCR